MKGLIYDVRYALRSVWRDKGFFAFAAVIVGLGIGATTAVFSVMSPLLLEPLPFEEPERLVWLAHAEAGGMSAVTSRTSNLRDYRRLSETLEELTGYFAFFEYESYNLVGDGEPERLSGVGVAHDFLRVLGVRPALGRDFVEEEGLDNARSVAILTHDFWTARFSADPRTVGSTMTLNGTPFEIVGVLPPTFDFSSTFVPGSRVDFLYPFPISDRTDQWGNTMAMIGRLAPGATLQTAQAEIDVITEQLQQEDPERWGLGAVVSGLQDHVSGGFRPSLWLLAAAAGTVMLIACANLSNLMLVRGVKRHKEMSLRSVLGAGRWRLVRQLLAESVVLSVGGAGLGIGIAWLATRAVRHTTGVSVPMLSSVAIDSQAALFTVGLALLAALLLAFVPALQLSPGREAAAINDASRSSTEGRGAARLREVLVVAEVALACVLLVGGGLLLRSFVRVLDVDLGFEPESAMAWTLETNRDFESNAARIAFYDALVEDVLAIPGVDAVGLSDTLPLGRNRSWGLLAKGVTYERGEGHGAFPRLVDHRYVQAMGIPLIDGRPISPADAADTQPVALLNESAAREVFPGQDAIGKTILTGSSEFLVVGVVGDVRHQSLEGTSGLEMYLPLTQVEAFGPIDMVVRSRVAPAALVGPVREVLHGADPAMPAGEFTTLEQIVDRAVSPRRFVLLLLAAFAAAALLLAALGIYGVLSYSVAQRRSEIGIRMALGESAARVRRRVVGRAVTLALAGIVIGTAASVAVTRLIASMLFGVGTADATTYAAMVGILLAASALAGYLPARRASRSDPLAPLRAS